MKFEGKIISLSVEDILPNRFQPRITFMENQINELAESIKSYGVIQPIVVRKIGTDKYEIIAGERRYKANLLAGNDTIPAIITELNDNDSAEIALIENIQREDLTAIEEAVSYKKLLDMGRLKQDDLAKKLGKKQSTVSNKLRLLNLEEEVQEALLEKRISERHARSLLKLSGSDQKKMLDKILTERLTVRKTDLEIEKLTKKPEEKNIEVLDFVVKPASTDKKGNDNMNQENFGFNIPTTPIIEENKPEGISSIPIAPTVSPSMPGFMDVNKIEETATDINVERPTVDVTSLLSSNKEASMNSTTPATDASIFSFNPDTPTQTTMPTPEEPEKPVGRFFDLGMMPQFEESNTSVELPKVEETISEVAPSTGINVDSLNNLFTADKKVEIEKVVTPVEEIKEPESIFNFNTAPKNPEFVEDVEKAETNMNFNIPTIEPAVIPTITNDINILSESNIDNNLISPQEINPVIPEIKLETPTLEVAPISTPIEMAEIKIDPIKQNVEKVDPVIPVVQPAIANQTPAYAVPDTSDLDAFLDSLDNDTPLSGIVNEPAPEVILEANATTPINMAPVDTEKMNKIKAIISEAKDKIAALGVRVEIDEFDFDDMYQAIIKLDK